jgi:hypothetical protein
VRSISLDIKLLLVIDVDVMGVCSVDVSLLSSFDLLFDEILSIINQNKITRSC